MYSGGGTFATFGLFKKSVPPPLFLGEALSEKSGGTLIKKWSEVGGGTKNMHIVDIQFF